MRAKIENLEKGKNKKIWIVCLVVVLLIAVGGGVYLYQQNNNGGGMTKQTIEQLLGGGGSEEQSDVEVIAQVGKIILLPDETPTMATVLDTSKLPDQSFFKNAENGDKLLIFTQNQKAILFRPQTQMIIEVMPLIVDQAALQTSD